MVSLIAQLCGLCAVTAVLQMILPEKEHSGIGLLCGLLMLHLVLTQASELLKQMLAQRELMGIFEILIK